MLLLPGKYDSDGRILKQIFREKNPEINVKARQDSRIGAEIAFCTVANGVGNSKLASNGRW
jgi:hypothetical protein